jgi:outer membrane lipoprotein SlyB
MRGNQIYRCMLSLAAAAGLAACASNGVAPGIVNSAAPPTQSQTYSSNNAPTGYQPAQANANVQPGDTGRVVSVNEVALAGSGGGGGSGGMGNGTMMGALLGGLGGAAIGIGTSHGPYRLGGGLIGGVLGAVGGGILGTIVDQQSGRSGRSGGRGIEVTVQKDDGQKVTIAQRDDGDVQLGDRVQIVPGPGGVPTVVRDNSHTPDQTQGGYANNNPPPDYSQQQPPPSQQQGSYPGNYVGSNPAYSNNAPQSGYSQQGGSVNPQDNPRYGNLN